MSMSRSNNLSQKRVEQVCVKEKKCFKTLILCVLQVNFFTAMKVNRVRMQAFADHLLIFLFHELQSKVSNIKDRLAIKFLG